MAIAEITPDTTGITGVRQAPTTGTVEGHKIDAAVADRAIIIVRNNHATLARDVTIETSFSVIGLNLGHQVVSIPALDWMMIGPFPSQYFNRVADPDKDFIYIKYDVGNETDMEIEVYDVP